MYTTADSSAYLLHKLVLEMDQVADVLLKQRLRISYKRAYFLFTIQRRGVVCQRDLAAALGYTPASVSTMVASLAEAGLVTASGDPTHKKRRLIALTPKGQRLATSGMELLDQHFEEAMRQAEVNKAQYTGWTKQLSCMLHDAKEIKSCENPA